MYSLRVSSTPALGKAIDARMLIEEQIRIRQAQGMRCGLAQSQYGAGLPLVATFMFNTLADQQSFRESTRSNSDFQLFQHRMASLLHEPPTYQLVEHLTQQPPAPPSPPRFAQRIQIVPLAGKQMEVRNLLEERVNMRLSQGHRATLSQIVSGGPQAFTVVLSFSSIADVDALTQANRSDQTFAEFQQRLAPMISATATIELLEILVPMPVQAREPAMAGGARR